MEIVKVENRGQSQIIRIPKKFHLKTSQVTISRRGSKIILSPVSQEDKLMRFWRLRRALLSALTGIPTMI